MRTIALATGLLILAIAGCLGAEPDSESDYPSIPGPPMPADVAAGETVSMLLLGDQGTQLQDQLDTARAMKQVCDDNGCDFAVALGDNIYTVGPVLGTLDPQFQTAFEIPYSDFDMPFYLTLGNHDNGATGHVVVHGDWEVAYTYSQESSGRWQMPSRYYNQTFSNGTLEIWSVDTDTLTAGDSLSGIRLGPDVIYSQREQVEWLRRSVANSTAAWKAVFGHYQYTTDGYKGDGDALLKSGLEEAMCDRVQFYWNGHQHDLRWQAPVKSCGRTEIIISGAAARPTHEPSVATDLGIEEYFTHDATAGFWWLGFNSTSMTGIAYGVDANDPTKPVELFRRTVTMADLGWQP